MHVVWGIGSISHCLLGDATFEQLLHSLHPTGWTSDGGQALARALVRTWPFTASAGLQQRLFKVDGRVERRVGFMNQTAATVMEGRFTLRDGELTLVPNHRPQSPTRYRVRLYDEWFWVDGNTPSPCLRDTGKPPIVIPYFRVDESDRWWLPAANARSASRMLGYA